MILMDYVIIGFGICYGVGMWATFYNTKKEINND